MPEGTEVWTNLDAIHKDKTLWKNPEIFDPTHFLDAEGKFAGIPPAFKPFGGGRRVCAGEALAKPMLLVRFYSSSDLVALLFAVGMATLWSKNKMFFFLPAIL